MRDLLSEGLWKGRKEEVFTFNSFVFFVVSQWNVKILLPTCRSCCPETDSFQRRSFLHCSRDPAPARGTVENNNNNTLQVEKSSRNLNLCLRTLKTWARIFFFVEQLCWQFIVGELSGSTDGFVKPFAPKLMAFLRIYTFQKDTLTISITIHQIIQKGSWFPISKVLNESIVRSVSYGKLPPLSKQWLTHWSLVSGMNSPSLFMLV